MHSLVSFAGTNWGLPLAIAANLQVPYRIELGHSHAVTAEVEDRLGAGKSFTVQRLNYI